MSAARVGTATSTSLSSSRAGERMRARCGGVEALVAGMCMLCEVRAFLFRMISCTDGGGAMASAGLGFEGGNGGGRVRLRGLAAREVLGARVDVLVADDMNG